MSTFTGLWGLPKKIRKEKSTVEANEGRKVTIVGSLLDVHLTPANEEVKRSLMKYQSTGRLHEITSSKRDTRSSRSDTECHPTGLHRSASDELLSKSHSGLLKRVATEESVRGSPEQTNNTKLQIECVSEAMSLVSGSLSAKTSPLVSPLSLEMGPDFGVEDFLHGTKAENDNENLSETSVSLSSSPEMWESKPRSYSSVSSNSSLRSIAIIEQKPSDTKLGQLLNHTENTNLQKSGDLTSQVQAEATKGSAVNRRNQKQYLELKPLPPVPPALSVAAKQQNILHAPIHVAKLASKYSDYNSRAESPVDRLIIPIVVKKTLSEAADDLERELDKLADVQPNSGSPRPRSPAEDEHIVAPLNIPQKRDARFSTESAPSMQRRPESLEQKNQPVRKQRQTYKVFPQPSKSIPVNMDKVILQHNRQTSKSSADTEPAESSIKQEPQESPSTKSVSRKIRASVHLPSLRRPRFNQLVHSKHNNKTEDRVKSPVISLRDDQAALARSTDRYIDAEIAKALRIDHEEDDDEDDEDSRSIHDGPSEEGEWSTMYPLKAVKKLGIPLMTNSHIPRLSSSENEKVLRQQLPKLDTNSIISAIERQINPLSATATDRKYPETPDDIGLRVRSFILDSSPVQTPTVEKDPFENKRSADSDKVFVSFDRMETVPEDTSPKIQEVPLIMGFSSAAQLSKTCRSRPQSTLYELDEYGSSPISLTPRPMENIRLPMPSHITDNIIIALMSNVNNLDGLFNYAQVNRQFYRVFKANELSLIKNALFNMNPPAWELREMSPPWSEDQTGLKDPDAPVPQYTPSSYLRHYARDVFALARLKGLIYARCGSFMRPESLRGLTGDDDIRASEIDEAFWRIWTFCRIFGCGKNREGDINGQIDWLNAGFLAKRSKSGATVITPEPFSSVNNVLFDPPTGFGDGNGEGLTCSQLYDMTEIWNCLGTLVQDFHRECKEARVAGVFNGLDVSIGDIPREEAMLEEWTHYLLTLGPSALVGLSSVRPHQSVKEMFTKANEMGVTSWEAPEDGGSRSTFLREAISRAYEKRVASQQKISTSTTSNSESTDSAAASNQRPNDSDHPAMMNRGGQAGHSITRDGRESSGHPVPPYTAANHDDAIAGVSNPPPRYSATEAKFVDPVDKAIHKMVHDLGFSERDSKWALKITDTGDMLDINAAIQLLIRERDKREKSNIFQPPPEITGDRNECLVDTTRHRGTVAWRWA